MVAALDRRSCGCKKRKKRKKGKKDTQNIEPAPKPRVTERKKAKCGANWFENRKIQTASSGWGTPVLMAHRIVPSFEKPRGASTCVYVMYVE